MTATLPTVSFSSDQAKAASAILDWFTSKGKQCLSLGGYAGTGKTTLIRHIVSEVSRESDVVVLAPTGKAAHVLRSKGIDAKTIHSHLYTAHTDPATGAVSFRLKERSAIEADLCIVDEASMVGHDLASDLGRYSDKILWVGDHGQLEPFGNDAGLMHTPDIRLETIHRQANDNPIIRFAHYLREGGNPSQYVADDERLRVVNGGQRAWNLHVTAEPGSINITPFNRTRVQVNQFVRSLRGMTGMPCEGEPVVCLQNNREHGVFNGMCGTLASVQRVGRGRIYNATIEVEDGDRLVRCPMFAAQFGSERGPEQFQSGVTYWDWAYCLTCHKAQGGEWDTVVVCDCCWEDAPWSLTRWRYTAATRAANRLVYLT